MPPYGLVGWKTNLLEIQFSREKSTQMIYWQEQIRVVNLSLENMRLVSYDVHCCFGFDENEIFVEKL